MSHTVDSQVVTPVPTPVEISDGPQPVYAVELPVASNSSVGEYTAWDFLGDIFTDFTDWMSSPVEMAIGVVLLLLFVALGFCLLSLSHASRVDEVEEQLEDAREDQDVLKQIEKDHPNIVAQARVVHEFSHLRGRVVVVDPDPTIRADNI